MITIQSNKQETEIEHGPSEITEDNVIFWSRNAKEFTGTPKSKALKLLKYDCVHYLGDNKFICLPLNTDPIHKTEFGEFAKKPFETNYSNSEYIIESKKGTFECNCQAYHTRVKKGEIKEGGANCAHTLSLFMGFKIGRFRR